MIELNNWSRAKGQLISKCLFSVLNSPKKRTKTIRLELPYYNKVKFFHSFFGTIEDTKKTFRNQLTFSLTEKCIISSIYSRNQIITNLISCCGPFLAPKLFFFIWLWNEARNRSLNEQWLCKFLISLESLLKFHKHISKILPWIFFWFGTRTFVLRCIDCQSAGLEGPNISPVP